MLRYVLLAVIAEGGPLHGYALMKAFAARCGIRLSIGNVYRELHRLRSDGHVQVAEKAYGADPRQAPYAITDTGRAALAGCLAMPAESFVRESVDPLYCRLALLAYCDAAQATRLLDDLATELEQQTRMSERRSLTADGGSSVSQVLARRRTRRFAADLDMIADMRAALTPVSTRPGLRVERHPARLDANPSRTERQQAGVGRVRR
jgi:DNA-binding PadR family transcriptional regulator